MQTTNMFFRWLAKVGRRLSANRWRMAGFLSLALLPPLGPISGFAPQAPGPGATTGFITWWYWGLCIKPNVPIILPQPVCGPLTVPPNPLNFQGVGGWIIFFLISMAAVIYLLYDSSRRRLPATGWKMGVILTTCLLLPTILVRVLAAAAAVTLAAYWEPIFYVGLLGGIVPVVLAIAYFITFQGMLGCPDGHVYEAELGQCPDPAHIPQQPIIYPRPEPRPDTSGRRHRVEEREAGPAVPLTKRKPMIHAWLVTSSGKSMQLYQRESSIGRSSQNDVYLTGDTTVSRQHAKILEQDGRFRLVDLGSKSGTRVNGRLVREPVLLEPDDEIQFGDNSVVRFVTARR